MKGLTLWEPWASLIAIGAKTIETRSWPTRYRGLVAIHAAKRADEEITFQCGYARDKLALMLWEPPSERHERIGRIPFGAKLGTVLAVARLADCRPMSEAPDPINAEFGHFGPGRYGWVMEDVVPLDEPVPWRGAQGLWEVPAELADRLVAQQAVEG